MKVAAEGGSPARGDVAKDPSLAEAQPTGLQDGAG